jgi:hypothetical protein
MLEPIFGWEVFVTSSHDCGRGGAHFAIEMVGIVMKSKMQAAFVSLGQGKTPYELDVLHLI